MELGNLSALWNMEVPMHTSGGDLYRHAFGTMHVCPDNYKVYNSVSPEYGFPLYKW